MKPRNYETILIDSSSGNTLRTMPFKTENCRVGRTVHIFGKSYKVTARMEKLIDGEEEDIIRYYCYLNPTGETEQQFLGVDLLDDP